jgi:hypothetical protein
MLLYVILGVVLGAFLLVVLRGAPYVPTHAGPVKHVFEMLDMPKGSTIVDLGSGDGVLLKAAAKRGYHAIGYELNPFLCLISYLRCWRYRHLVSVRWRDFWLSPLPGDVAAVFIFLSGPYLHRLDRKLSRERPKNAGKPLMVVSYGFLIPGKGKPIKTEQALHLYHY